MVEKCEAKACSCLGLGNVRQILYLSTFGRSEPNDSQSLDSGTDDYNKIFHSRSADIVKFIYVDCLVGPSTRDMSDSLVVGGRFAVILTPVFSQVSVW